MGEGEPAVQPVRVGTPFMDVMLHAAFSQFPSGAHVSAPPVQGAAVLPLTVHIVPLTEQASSATAS